MSVKVPVTKATAEQARAARGRFASLTGPIAFAATGRATKTEVNGVRWEEIPDYGRGERAMAVYPVTAASVLPPAAAPQLEYPVYLPRSGTYRGHPRAGPGMDFVPNRGMRIAVSFDDEAPQVLDIFADREAETFLGRGWWYQFTRDNARFLRSSHTRRGAGTAHPEGRDGRSGDRGGEDHHQRPPGASELFGPPERSPVD